MLHILSKHTFLFKLIKYSLKQILERQSMYMHVNCLKLIVGSKELKC